MVRLKRIILVILAFLAGVAMTRLIERTSGGAEPEHRLNIERDLISGENLITGSDRKPAVG